MISKFFNLLSGVLCARGVSAKALRTIIILCLVVAGICIPLFFTHVCGSIWLVLIGFIFGFFAIWYAFIFLFKAIGMFEEDATSSDYEIDKTKISEKISNTTDKKYLVLTFVFLALAGGCAVINDLKLWVPFWPAFLMIWFIIASMFFAIMYYGKRTGQI